MAGDLSRILIENIVRKTLKDMKDSPERSTRNLVDMALHFSTEEGTFQKRFFEIAQGMLRKEDSGYFKLIQSLALARSFPDSAFLIFCEPDSITNKVLEAAKSVHNIMFVVKYEESVQEICELLRLMGFLYSIYIPSEEETVDSIFNNELLRAASDLYPIFTFFLDVCGCPKHTQTYVYDNVKRIRDDQRYATFAEDGRRV